MSGGGPADLPGWRSGERKRLRAERLAVSAEERGMLAHEIARHLDRLVAEQLGSVAGRVISGYWPIKAEPDLRFWMEAMSGRGACMALPVVEVPSSPLVFRAWAPGARMERGHWNIPVPSSDAERLVPEIALAPLVGWDGQGFRLGYGGGYFDRTLAALSPRPFVIGVGLQSSRIDTIFPQRHDIRLDAIVTEEGLQWLAGPASLQRGVST
ncbi:5-formyltetrahydrofolate cyclo-ligase [Aestuariivirga sp.]|uniref:5-formyltetrahydrofolate cyclo-ligase n=1 Tax=Aestuariivirga sp. TaxID=2650926 RepID=UPI00391D2D77